MTICVDRTKARPASNGIMIVHKGELRWSGTLLLHATILSPANPGWSADRESRGAAPAPGSQISGPEFSQLARETLGLPLTDCSAHARLITYMQQHALSGGYRRSRKEHRHGS
jgi:hypothetical protein